MKSKTFPTLYGLSKNGKTKEWNVSVKEDGPEAELTVTHGYRGQAFTDKTKRFNCGKNLGKRNATTSFEQATSEARSAWDRKKDQGYVEEVKDLATIKLRPMLAHDYTKHGAKIEFPCWAQPKLNGVRCLAVHTEEGIDFFSRNGKSFPVLQKHKDLVKCLKEMMPVGSTWDGEIYVHGWRFQHIVSALTAFSTATLKLQYHVYDVVENKKIFVERFKEAKKIAHWSVVEVVPTYICGSKEAADKWQTSFVERGYEGLMLRNYKGLYVPNYRSYDLQKYKTFIDEEFEIVGATYDVEGGVIWTCSSKYADPFDNLFNVRPMGTLTQRKKMWTECTKYFGKQLTVKYQELSVDGMPIFPVGIGVREYE